MPQHAVSVSDLAFRSAFDAGRIAPSAFDHRAHVRLAYVHLVEHGVAGAPQAMRASLQVFLASHGIAPSKYHETLTRAWTLAVAHFMARHPGGTFESFSARSTPLFDSRVMLTHYTPARLFSDAARAAWVEPDLDPIPH
ncbi:hypothetical protein ACQQ2N_13245 [Dokdonella sp. MW10]|uniref:hypothetical protein n=1 Tax=Dokdonella sp. MW10 TaxID=2992926 RepID=UPI003F7D0EE6